MSTTLGEDQQKALKDILAFLDDPEEKEFLLEGYAGTGKTFLIKYVVDFFNKKQALKNLLTKKSTKKAIYATATTHQALRVLMQNLGDSVKETNYATIHALLNVKVQIDYLTGKTYLTRKKRNFRDTLYVPCLGRDCIIFIDEASMITAEILKYIREVLPAAKIIYVLDKYQLMGISNE